MVMICHAESLGHLTLNQQKLQMKDENVSTEIHWEWTRQGQVI